MESMSPMQTIFPILRYDDARAAIEWLGAAFGFGVRFTVPEQGVIVRHAQLALGTNTIMLGSTRGDGISTPRTLGSSTQALYVCVQDLEAHFDRARTNGAIITSPPRDTDFGAREYHALDPEGHSWTFGTYAPDASPVASPPPPPPRSR